MTGPVLVVDEDAQWWQAELGARFSELSIAGAPSFAQAGPYLAQAEILISIGIGFTGEVVAQMPRLAWVQSLVSGYEHLRAALTDRGDVLLTTSRGIHGPQMTETALLHMLMLTRGGRRIVDQQRTRTWAPWNAPTLASKVATIVGLGAVGRRLGLALTALGMTVIGVSRSSDCPAGFAEVLPPDQLTSGVSRADYVVLVAPARPDGSPLIGAAELRAMRPTAYLVNLGRGSLIDEPALVEALRAGALAGAGLDVFSEEPLGATSPLWGIEGIVVTPHLGGRCDRYAEAALTVVEPNLRRYLADERDTLANLV